MSEKARYFGSETCIKAEQFAYPCWLFSFGSIAGWMLEVVFRSIIGGAFCNPGFSFGPYCPIYGFGFLIIVYLCAHKNRFIAFGKVFLLASLLEYSLSALTENLFHELLWDYSNLPLSIGTRVNLVFSLVWGMLGLFVLAKIEPWMRRIFDHHSVAIRKYSIGMSCLIIADVLISTLAWMV